MSFTNDNVLAEVIFDQFVPTSESGTAMHEHPFYSVGRHNRPDITIDLYDKTNDWYIGSIILECKYRKLSSFWYGSDDWSSKPQLRAYSMENNSRFTYNGIGEKLDVRPIKKVLVLTPDLAGDDVGSKKINTSIIPFKPTSDDSLTNHLMNVIDMVISEALDKSKYCQSLLG